MRTSESRRVKCVRIHPELIICVLNWCRNPGGKFLSLPQCDEIPEDAKVVAVTADFESNCFKAIIQHESFDMVEPGVYPPMIGDYLRSFRTFIRKHEPSDTMVEVL